MPDHDPVNHPSHYGQHPSGVKCIEITEHMNFCLGNAVKYIWRADLKGDAIEDLRKAAWYIQREIARRENTPVVEEVPCLGAGAEDHRLYSGLPHFSTSGSCSCTEPCCNTLGGACICPDCSGTLCVHDDRRARSAS